MTQMSAAQKPRPKHLDLRVIRLPLPGLVSIFHRVSGAGLFLMLPVLLWLFQASLESPQSHAAFLTLAAHPLVKVVFLGLIWAYLHHFCAGLRFLALDLDLGTDLPAARLSSKLVLIVSLAATALVGGLLLW